MKRFDFILRHPRLFHMAADGSWPSIQERGLLSTRALVDLYGPPLQVRAEILDHVRRRSYVLARAGLPDAVVRDQLPLKFLSQCLLPGVTERDFLDALNGRVFFFVDPSRLSRLLNARAYRRHPQTVLTLDTESFLADHPRVELAPYNTGSVHLPTMPARGPSTYVPIDDFSFDEWRLRRGPANAIVELTVPLGAPRVARSVLQVERWSGGEPVEELYRAG